jgi:hypothetical protein
MGLRSDLKQLLDACAEISDISLHVTDVVDDVANLVSVGQQFARAGRKCSTFRKSCCSALRSNSVIWAYEVCSFDSSANRS